MIRGFLDAWRKPAEVCSAHYHVIALDQLGYDAWGRAVRARVTSGTDASLITTTLSDKRGRRIHQVRGTLKRGIDDFWKPKGGAPSLFGLVRFCTRG